MLCQKQYGCKDLLNLRRGSRSLIRHGTSEEFCKKSIEQDTVAEARIAALDSRITEQVALILRAGIRALIELA